MTQRTYDRKEFAISLLAEGFSLPEIARKIGVHHTTVYRWFKGCPETAHAKVIAHPSAKRSTAQAHMLDKVRRDTVQFAFESSNDTKENMQPVSLISNPESLNMSRILNLTLTGLGAAFTLAATSYLVWETGEALGNTSGFILAGLLELGAVLMTMIPVQGKRSVLKWAFLTCFCIYSTALLCNAQIAQSRAKSFAHETRTQLLQDLRSQIAIKSKEVEQLTKSGYLGASRKISSDLSDLEKNLVTHSQAAIATSSFQNDSLLWLCTGRTLLVCFNLFFVHLLSSKFSRHSRRFFISKD